MNGHTNQLALALIGLVFFFSGCATLVAPSDAKIEAAFEARDKEQLEFWCNNPATLGTAKDASNQACRRHRQLVSEDEVASAHDRFMAEIDCDNAVEMLENYQGDERNVAFERAVDTLVGCNAYAKVFDGAIASGIYEFDKKPYRELVELRESGEDVESEILQFVRESTFEFDGADRTAFTIFTYLSEEEMGEECTDFARLLDSANSSVQYYFVRYMGATKCQPAVSKVADVLRSTENARVREQACWTLGRIGDSTHREVVETFAQNDGYFELLDERDDSGDRIKIYPVRNACGTALGRLTE